MAAKAEAVGRCMAWRWRFFLLGTCPAQGKRCQSLPSVFGNAAKLVFKVTCVMRRDLGCRMLCSLATFAVLRQDLPWPVRVR